MPFLALREAVVGVEGVVVVRTSGQVLVDCKFDVQVVGGLGDDLALAILEVGLIQLLVFLYHRLLLFL